MLVHSKLKEGLIEEGSVKAVPIPGWVVIRNLDKLVKYV